LAEAEHLWGGADARGRSVDLVFGGWVKRGAHVGLVANCILVTRLLFALIVVDTIR
jgi:hypothetical protein